MRIRYIAAVTVLLTALTFPSATRADRGEFYTLLTIEPQLGWYTEPLAGRVSATNAGGGAALTAYYGFTNSLHVGGDLHLSAALNINFPDTTISLNGTPSTGTVYANSTCIGANAVVVYRYDTGLSVAPLGRFEIGATSLGYTNIQYVPNGQSYVFNLPSSSELALELRGALLAEYRFGNHIVASAGFAVTAHPGARAPWSVSVPVSIGWIW